MANIGTAVNLVAGTITLTNISRCLFWYIQNQDTQPLKVAFQTATADTNFGPIILNAAAVTGAGGGYLDSIKFPYFGDLTLTSTIATAQFGSGATLAQPIEFREAVGGSGVQTVRGGNKT